MMLKQHEALTRTEARAELRLLLREEGAKTKFCKKHRVHPTVLSNFLADRRPPGPRLLRAMKLEPMLIYVRKTK